MSTTKKGRYIHRAAPYNVQLKKLWRIGPECGRLTLNYRMGHTLEEMGVALKPTDWSRVIVRKSSSTPPSSPSSTPTGSPPPSSLSTPTDSCSKTMSSSSIPTGSPKHSRSSSPSSSMEKECTSDVIRITSTEIKTEPDILEDPQISPVHLIATK